MCATARLNTRFWSGAEVATVVAAVVPLWSGSKKLHLLQAVVAAVVATVVPLQPFKNTKTATTSANGLRIQQNQVCWKANDMG